ncbi:hypothetical protein [Nocardia sp. NPDC060259]|uniref:hypothetical protein n=1 Tax=Nocardia sp. NPDC060259 TaxID=3347088 RepID=UPI00365E7934
MDTNPKDSPESVSVDVMIRALKALAGGAPDLDNAQRRLPCQFAALRTAHGDFRTDGGLRAFFTSPVLLVSGYGSKATATLTFGAGTLPKETTLVISRGRLTESKDFDVDPDRHTKYSIEITIPDYGEDVLLVEAVDPQGVLLGFGVPTVPVAPG